MNHATRLPYYQQIEAERGSRVLAFVTSERNGLQTQTAGDAMEPFIAILDQIGPVAKLSLILDTTGGDTSAAWRLINLIRSFCDELEVVVPSKAMSAGTLMALGANRILMTKQAALGPIDPSLTHAMGPELTLPGGQTIRFPVSAEAVRGYINEVKKDVTDPGAMAGVWTHLAGQIHPIVLGEIFRRVSQIRMLAQSLIQSQVTDVVRQGQIIDLLCSESGSHDYTIDRRQATSIGLNIEKPTAESYTILSAVLKSYHDELKTLEPYSLQSMLGSKPSVSYTLVRGLIESTQASYGFVTDGQAAAQVGHPAPAPIINQTTFEGWRRLP